MTIHFRKLYRPSPYFVIRDLRAKGNTIVATYRGSTLAQVPHASLDDNLPADVIFQGLPFKRTQFSTRMGPSRKARDLFRRHTTPAPSISHHHSTSSSIPSSTTPSLPSLSVDYNQLDAEDPPLDNIGWLSTIALFGFSARSRSDPRYRALAKFRRLTMQHGIEDITIHDLVRALRVFAAMVDRNAKEGLKQRRDDALPGDPVAKLDRIQRRERKEIARKRSRRRNIDMESYSDLPKESKKWSLSDLDGTSDEALQRWSMPDIRESFADNHSESEEGGERDERVTASEGTLRDCEGMEGPAPCVKVEHVQLLYHMLRHAESIYGFPVSVPSAPRTVFTKVTDRRIVCTRAGLRPADIKLATFTATAFMPVHYVAVDRQIRAIVVCVRGTANLVDSLTDVAATHDPFFVRATGGKIVKGYGHSGVLRSARNLFGHIREATLAALSENEGFELMVTGHSLGAATASVLAMIMREDPRFPRVLAFCFAPLPCLSLEIADMTDDFVVTVVNGPDIVPSLSVAVMLPYIATVRYVKDMRKRRKALVAVGLRSVAVKWEELKRHNEEMVRELQKYHEGCRLYIPGKVFQLVQRNEVHRRDVLRNRLFRRTEVEVVAVRRTNFLEVRAREKGMFVSHAPFSYRRKLQVALKGLGGERLKIMNGGWVFRSMMAVPIARFLPVNDKKREASWGEMLDRLWADDDGFIPVQVHAR